ncbi:MAG: type III glutamate--ammonia ligase [Neptuniibacter sp.]
MTQMLTTEPSIWVCPEENALEAAHQFLERHKVKYILAQFVDLHGGIKSKAAPVHCLQGLTEDGAGFAGAAILGFDMTPKDPEYMMVADLSTLTLLPWLPGYACIRGVGMVGDTPYPLDPRNVLAAQTARLQEKGLRFMTGLEPELYLLKRDENGAVTPFDSTDTLDKPAYDYQGITRNTQFLESMYDALSTVGLNVYQIDHEDANGQFEMNFEYDEALKSADNIQFFKMAAKEVANNIGAICSFLPKLSATTTGNGMHMHCSLVDEQGVNVFQDDSDPSGMGLSKTAYQFIAGVIEHAPALTALLCPSVNSYKRLVLGSPGNPSWAPVFIAYGDNNRSAMVRIPYGRLEVRIGDGSMNTYLATAAVIAAGMDGIERGLEAPQPHAINFYDLSSEQLNDLNVSCLPDNLSYALDALDEDTLLAEALGERLVASFIKLKRQEWTEYHNTVSDWEINRYLTFY